MYQKLKILQHKHTGRLRPHEHTSYLGLAVLVLFTGFVLSFFSVASFASASPGPQGGSVSLTGTMPAKPPTTAAVISSPTDGQHFTTSPITVSGTCPDATLVVIYKNDIFAGSAPCGDDNTFTMKVDLLIGQNILKAQVYDALNQAGPESTPVTVYYDIVPPQTEPISLLALKESQLLLNTDAVYRGIFPGQSLSVPVGIIGGTGPYAIDIEWGDSTNTVYSRSDSVTFNATHSYKKPGTYVISIQATDSQQHVAFLQVTAIVNGVPETIASTSAADRSTTNQLLVLWPLFAIAISVVTSFWLGEQREKRLLANAVHA